MTLIPTRLALLAALALPACDPSGIETVHIALTAPQSLDPSLVHRVVVAAVQSPDTRCVLATGANTCADLQSTAAAEQDAGHVGSRTLTAADGSVATFDDLPRGTICFVAEALSSTDAPLALGCAEVKLTLDEHRIEIAIAEVP